MNCTDVSAVKARFELSSCVETVSVRDLKHI